MTVSNATARAVERRRLILMIFLMTLMVGLVFSGVGVVTQTIQGAGLLDQGGAHFISSYLIVMPTVAVTAPLARWLSLRTDQWLFGQAAADATQAALAAWRANAAGHRGESFEPWLQALAEDVRIWTPLGTFRGENVGKARAREIYAAIAAAHPRLTYEAPLRVSQSEHTVVIEFDDHGQIAGMPYRNRIAASFDIKAGQVVGYREYFGDIDPKVVALMTESTHQPHGKIEGVAP